MGTVIYLVIIPVIIMLVPLLSYLNFVRKNPLKSVAYDWKKSLVYRISPPLSIAVLYFIVAYSDPYALFILPIVVILVLVWFIAAVMTAKRKYKQNLSSF